METNRALCHICRYIFQAGFYSKRDTKTVWPVLLDPGPAAKALQVWILQVFKPHRTMETL